MPKHDSQLHPDQAQPYYMTIPVEEYEALKDEINHLRSLNETMRVELERRGVIVIPSSAELEIIRRKKK